MKRQKPNSFSPGSFQTDGRKKKGKSLYVCDKKLLPRLRQLLNGHSKGRQPSLDEVVDCLQEKYGEYGRKKKSTFRVSVQKVYQTIKNENAEEQKLQELEEKFLGKRKDEADFFPLDMEEDSENGLNMSSDSELTDGEMGVDFHNGNLVNRSMHEMYKTSNSRRNSEEENDESIDTRSMNVRTSVSKEKSNDISGNLNSTQTDISKKRNFFKSDVSKAPSFSRNGVFKTNDVTKSDSSKTNDVTRKESSGTNDVIRNNNNDVMSHDVSKTNDVTRKESCGTNDVTRNNNDVTRNDVSKTNDVTKNVISKTNDVTTKDISNINDISQREDTFGDYTTPENKNKRSRNVPSTRKSSVKRDKKERSEDTRKRQNENDVLRDDTDKIPLVPLLRFSDLGGCDECIQEVCKLLIHIKHPEVFKALGITPPRGFLLHGPPGCGKTLLGHAIAGELDVPLVNVASTEMVSGVSGESEGKIRDLFTRASAHAPCVLFLDEIDAITPKRETASKEMERRIVAQLLSCLDDLNRNQEVQVVVIGATNRPDSLDPALRRAGRFDREIRMGIPDEQAREQILQVQCKDLKLSGEFDFKTLARQTPGFVGADLMALAREAAMCAVTRIFHRIENEKAAVNTSLLDSSKNVENSDEKSHSSIMTWLKSNQTIFSEEELKNLSIEMADFTKALQEVQPSAKREGFATIPDVTWEDIGALEDIREELTMAIIAPVRHRQAFTELGLTNPPGILLAGPPGCGKTLLAKAIANESGINFISVKGPELLNMYVGESERAVRQVFQRAANSAPCVIFFDELDALCPRRSHGAESNASARVVNQLLTEMDGLETRKQVFIMGATNRPDIIDPAILRPGRLDKVLYVGLPREIDRLAILQTLTKRGTRPRLREDVDLTAVAADERCQGFSGADLAALVREASVNSLRQCMKASAKDSGIEWEPSAAKDSGMAYKPSAAKDSGMAYKPAVKDSGMACEPATKDSGHGMACELAAAKDSGMACEPAAKDSGMACELAAAKDSGMPCESPAAKDCGMAWESHTTNQKKVEKSEKRHATFTGVSMRHFDQAFKKIKPSVSEKEQLIYRYMQERMATEKPLS